MAEEIYEKLAEKIFCKGSKLIPELFKMIADEKEAELMLALPGTVPELKEKLGWEEQEIEQMLNQLFRKGVVFKSKKPEGTKYRMCRDLGQFHDASILWPEAPQEFLDLWQRYMEEEWPEYSKMVEKIMPKPFTRVIPIGQAVSSRNQVLAFESLEEIIDQSPKLAVTKCTCRTIARKCDNPVEVCLQVGRAAEYTLERGTGREISKEEAKQILRECEERGLVHITINRTSGYHFICNCCECCCQVFPLLIKEGRKLCDPSRFQAEIDQEKCTGCEICLERCHFNALQMVTQNGREVAQVLAEKCMGCGLCAIKCPEEAISLIEVREKEFIPA